MEKISVKILKVDKELPTPAYKHHGDAGMDIYSAENAVLGPGEIKKVKTGVRFAIPYGYEIQLRPRSGLAANHGISIINTPCTIDAGYRGDIDIPIINHGKEAYEIKRGERIAQAVFKKVEIAELIEVDELDETARGESGFGSTGKF
ncbi:dUTP diphosphatase [Candidatus Woesearchaeota archaeon]|nr:dUTP diphosphatase [Candidatus Woesearchaeota archaeon]